MRKYLSTFFQSKKVSIVSDNVENSYFEKCLTIRSSLNDDQQ